MGRIREILVVPHAHHDVGYTHSPRVILPLHVEAVREALRLAGERTPDEGAANTARDPAAFRWTFENSRPVNVFLDSARPDEIAALGRLIAEGRLAVTGGYLNSTELLGQEEIVRSFEPVDRMRKHGLPVHVVQHSDINGLPWGTVPAMARANLDVLVMALNPDHGRPPFEQPTAFWWEGPDGSKVLAWLSLHYGLAEMWGLLDDDIDRFDAGLRATIARIERRDDYPFDFIVLHATDDNGWPTRHAAQGVRAWNERFGYLPMSTATMNTAMDRALDQAARGGLRTWRGEWADWWAHGHGSTAYEVGLDRSARSMLRTAEAALSLARLDAISQRDTERRTAWRRDPVRQRTERQAGDAAAAAWDELLLFGEHTWGADESVSAPDSLFTQSHWNAKAGMAFAAYDGARDLLEEALWRLGATLPPPPGHEPSIVVFNPAPAARSGPVAAEIDGATVEVVARDVPGFGVVRVPVPSRAVRSEPGNVLETGRFRIEVDPARGGIVSLVDRELGWDLVDRSSRAPLGALIVESLDRAVDHPVLRDGLRHFRPETPGPGFVRHIATGNGMPTIERGPDRVAIGWDVSNPTLSSAHATLAVHDGVERLRFTVTLTKRENRQPEGVYVAFPFAIEAPTVHLESGGAVFRAELDQLPDTCRDWYSVQHAVGIGNGARNVLWTTAEAPLVQVGAINTGAWLRHLGIRDGHLFAWLMNNLYFTNFRASQGGTSTFSFGIEPRAGLIEADDVRRAGELAGLPLVGRAASRAPEAATGSPPVDNPASAASATSPASAAGAAGVGSAAEAVLLEVDSSGATAVSLALDADTRSVRLRLQATSIGAESVQLTWRGRRRLAAWRADVFGNREAALAGDGRTFELALRPDELATVVLVPADEDGSA